MEKRIDISAMVEKLKASPMLKMIKNMRFQSAFLIFQPSKTSTIDPGLAYSYYSC
jgi:hypothetical protein